MARRRADLLVQLRGLAESRSKAQALILAGEVVAGDHRVDKPGQLLDEAIELRLKSGEALKYVSRGGAKLEHALDRFGLEARGLVCCDLGASTGGFTDVLLQRGALRVHAVDVGYGQLHPRLRGDPRVIVHERVNARALSPRMLGEKCGAAVADLSFISLKLVLPALASVLEPPAWCAVLVKPQFEAGREEVGKGGVVRDPAVHERVVEDVQGALRGLGFAVSGATPSPLLGPAGNREFLVAGRLL
ncbi:MAG TPA: TlyA family RNA methyltransferase [Myxococcales bacterium]|jgi:23S rRNA (cytidine1920-2'-O)/16S rRNA (cytidine1409-2'-O)-methyltransferase|nr:TlyA family RNA methyltransferase [Myxococcales bacterium]